MTIYILLYAFIAIMGEKVFSVSKSKSYQIIFVVISGMFIWFIEAFRSINIGEDTVSYIGWFEDIYNLGWKESLSGKLGYYVEPGYLLLNLVISTISNNPHMVLGVVSFIIIGLHFLFIWKYSENVYISILLYFGINFFLTSMTTLRQFIAMGIVFFMLPQIENKKYFRMLIIAFMAMQFHRSSLIFAVVSMGCIYFGKKIKRVKIILLIETVIVLLITPAIKIALIIIPKYEFYFQNGGNAELGLLRSVYIIIELFLIFLYIYYRRDIHCEKNNAIVIMTSFSAMIGVLNAFVPHIFRLGYYFDFFLIFLIPLLKPKNKNNKKIYFVCVIVGSTLLFLYYLATNAGGTVPYEMALYK